MRLQVFLSHNGICSRREAMVIIQEGRVKVNGRIETEPSFQVSGDETIEVNGRRVITQRYAYIMLHKPPGYTTTKDDPHADKTVLDLLPKEMHYLSPVGRLDRDSEGLLLLTNDGTWAFGLTHPKFHMDKVYQVRMKGNLSEWDKKQLELGILLDDPSEPGLRKTAPCCITQVRYNDANTELQIAIKEGRKRQIRRMFWSMGHKVTFLKRISIGPVHLGDLKPGQYRALTQEEIEGLRIK